MLPEVASIPHDPAFQAALHVVETLRAAGHQAYFAGGCVRDLLLGIAPKDYDVATSAGPEKVLLGFPRTFGVGAHFGVVIESAAFAGQSRVARQRLVNTALADLLADRIHALAIKATAPGET